MAIESINTMMTAQAQPVQNASNSTKPAVEYTEVSMADKGPKVDNATKIVEKSEGKDESYTDREPSREMLHKAVDDLNKKMSNSEVQYGFHEATNRVTIKIVDKESKKVIKELPPEKTLDLIAKAWELAGIMVDERR